jgi:hypothetical protein
MLQRERPQPPLEERTDRLHVIENSVIHQLLEEKQRGPAGEQVAAVRRAVVPGRDRARDTVRHEHRTDRDAAPERFADADEIGL